jgi:RHS repeat-associated protein
LRFDATPANPLYPIWPYNITIQAGALTVLPDWTIAPPPAAETFVPIANAAQDQKITDARYPGLEITLPAGVQIVGWDGVVKTRISVVRHEIDKLPVPPPPTEARAAYQLYFGTPMGGIPTAAIPVTLPNDLGLEPGESGEIWYFDGSPMAGSGEWKMAGTGTISADGLTMLPDAGVGIPRFCGVCGVVCQGKRDANKTPKVAAPAVKPACDPTQACCGQEQKQAGGAVQRLGKSVTLSTGQELLESVDLSCAGVVPIGVRRNYNPIDAFNNLGGIAGSLGLGWVMNYDVVLLPFDGTQKRIVLPGNEPVDFVDDGTGAYRNQADLRFAGGAMTHPDTSTWQFAFSDGTLWRFKPFADASQKVRGGAPYFLIEVVYPQGSSVEIQRNSVGRATSVGSSGRALQFSYGANNFISEVRDPLGRSVRYSYNAANRIETITDAQGGVERYTYVDDTEFPSSACSAVTGGSRIKTIQRPGKSEVQELFYGPGRRVLRERLEDGSENRFSYKLAGACVTHVSSPAVKCTTGCPTEDSWENFQAGWRISGGQVLATTAIDPANRPYTQRFNANAQGLEETDAAGQSVRYDYDANQRMVGTTDALGRTTRYAYDAKGNQTSIVDPLGRLIDIAYDPKWNKPISATRYLDDGTPVRTSFAYDTTRGLLTQITDALGNSTRMQYNGNGQLTAITPPLRSADGAERTWRLAYNDAGDLIERSDPLGNKSRFTPDAAGRVVTSTDALQFSAQVQHNALDQPIALIDPLGGITALQYDAQQRLERVINPLNNVVESYRYDALDRLLETTDAVGRSTSLRYDAAGQLTDYTDRKGQLKRFDYDARGQLIRIERPEGIETRSYDALGRLIRIEDASGAIDYTYDATDRLSRERTTAAGVITSVEYAYDALDRRIQRTVDGADPTTYRYDLSGRLIEIGYRGQATAYQWDEAGRLVRKSMPNGIEARYAYDAADRLTQIAYLRSSGGLIEQIDYTYDANGQRLARSAIGEAGNAETPFTASFDAANRLTQITLKGTLPNGTDDLCTLAYEDTGNLQTKSCDSGSTSYSWDSRNRLIGISSPTTSAAFTYDALGRRTNRTVNGSVTRYVYDGVQAIAEANGNVETGLLTGLAIDDVIARYTGGSHRVYLTDALSSVIAQAKDDQTVLNRYAYSPYGETGSTGADEGNDVRYTAREDDGTGLYFYRARYYDPQLKRFVAEDPIGLIGDFNLYNYAEQNPLLLSDPLGLEAPPGHHLFPQHIWKNLPLSPEARKVFKEGVIGPLKAPGEPGHNMGGGHDQYNKAVRELWDNYLKEKNLKPETLAKRDAEYFLNRIRRCPNPDIRDFNRRQYGRLLNYYMRRWVSPRSGE